MRVSVAGVLGLLLLSLIQAPVQAQSDGYVLYGIRTDGGYWITPNPDDPNEGGLWGSSVQGVAPAPYAPEAADGREWILNMYHPEAPLLRLDPAGTIVVAFTIGGGSGEAGTFDAGWQLRQDGTPVVSGPVKSVTYTQDTTSLLWDVPAGIEALDPATLSLRIFTESSAGLGQRLSFTDQPTISLPVVGGLETAPATHFGEIQGSISHAFDNATSDTYHLNLTTGLTNSTALFSWNALNGSVNATLADASGAIVFAGALEGDGSLAHEIVDAAVGAWNLTLVYHDFTGAFSFELQAMAVEEPEAPEPEPIDNSTVDDNATAPANPADKESPGPALLPLLVFLVASILRRRR